MWRVWRRSWAVRKGKAVASPDAPGFPGCKRAVDAGRAGRNWDSPCSGCLAWECWGASALADGKDRNCEPCSLQGQRTGAGPSRLPDFWRSCCWPSEVGWQQEWGRAVCGVFLPTAASARFTFQHGVVQQQSAGPAAITSTRYRLSPIRNIGSVGRSARPTSTVLEPPEFHALSVHYRQRYLENQSLPWRDCHTAHAPPMRPADRAEGKRGLGIVFAA